MTHFCEIFFIVFLLFFSVGPARGPRRGKRKDRLKKRDPNTFTQTLVDLLATNFYPQPRSSSFSHPKVIPQWSNQESSLFFFQSSYSLRFGDANWGLSLPWCFDGYYIPLRLNATKVPLMFNIYSVLKPWDRCPLVRGSLKPVYLPTILLFFWSKLICFW